MNLRSSYGVFVLTRTEQSALRFQDVFLNSDVQLCLPSPGAGTFFTPFFDLSVRGVLSSTEAAVQTRAPGNLWK